MADLCLELNRSGVVEATIFFVLGGGLAMTLLAFWWRS